MKIENRENYVLISSDENSFSDFYKSFLKKEKEFQNKNVILRISDEIKGKKENFSLFLDLAKQKKENGTSFAIISTKVNMDNFPEYFNIVPTLQEAKDILEMEAMERELGF
ncbi:MAG: hypothetical protein ACJAYY_003149 [Paraglaciecola sp.]|jgi:hypothetical protein|uniref:hypothetical protein n=1 Tax=Polaribacter sp. TaxID=1920175 RepID=UPI003AC46FAD